MNMTMNVTIIIFQSKLPTQLWGDWVSIATFLIHRITFSVLQQKSPGWIWI